jgi:hypothetical protein
MIRHDQDFYEWTQEQSRLLRAGRFDEVDFEHLIEEIESMGARERRELKSRLTVLLQHLLKWHFQPTHRSRSWRLTIQDQRRMIPDHLRDNPSLKNSLDTIFVEAYMLAKGKASDETDIPESSFPASCPWTLQEVLEPGFLPN